MSEEKQEIEIDIIGWWCVFHFDSPLAVFCEKELAESWIKKITVSRCWGNYSVKEITAKTDFIDASKIEVGGGTVKDGEKSFIISPKLTEALKELERRGHA